MELSFIRWLRERIAAHPQMPLGPGDDAALLQFSPGCQCVVTTDMLMDGVDFTLATTSARLVGRKALAVNLSDLAAMGAKPVAVVVALSLPRRGGESLAHELYEGILPLAAEFNTALAGGDTNSWDGPLVLSVTAIGEVLAGRAWQRSGARPGDQFLVTGDFGGSILRKHLEFQPRLQAARWLAENADVHAAIDVSDGLSLDLSRLATESNCGAALELTHVPVSPDARRLAQERKMGKTPLEHALSDGEDFELILAIPPAEAERLLKLQPLDVPLTRIGRFVDRPGLWSTNTDGSLEPLTPQGYEHRLEG